MIPSTTRKSILKSSTTNTPKDKPQPFLYSKGAIFLVATLMFSWIAVNQFFAHEKQYIHNTDLYSNEWIAVVDLILAILSIITGLILSLIADKFLDSNQLPPFLFPLILFGGALITLSTGNYKQDGRIILQTTGLMFLLVFAAILASCLIAISQFFPQERENLQREKAFLITFCAYHFGYFLLICFSPIIFGVCLVEDATCYQLRFVCFLIFIIIAWIIFVSGNRRYIALPPVPKTLIPAFNCVTWGLKCKFFFRTPPSPRFPRNWLFLAGGKYSSTLITEIRQVIRLIHFFWTIPLFWAAIKMKETKWLRISQRTNQKIGDTTFNKHHLFIINSSVIILGTFIFIFLIYPLLSKRKFIQNPLRRMLLGGIIFVLSDVMSNHVKYLITKNFPSPPPSDKTNVFVLNALPCSMDVQLGDQPTAILKPYSSFKFNGLAYESEISDYVEANWQNRGPDCIFSGLVTVKPEERKNYALVLGARISDEITFLQSEELSEIPPELMSAVRVVFYILFKREENIVLLLHHDLFQYRFYVGKELDPRFADKYQDNYLMFTSYENIRPLRYEVCWILKNYSHHSCDKSRIMGIFRANRGGIYNLLVAQNHIPKSQTEERNSKIIPSYNLTTHQTSPPSNFSIKYQIPQFMLIGVGELLFVTSSFEFFYTQSPPNFRSFILIMYFSFSNIGNSWVGVLTYLENLTLPYLQYFAYNLYPILMCINLYAFFELMHNYTYI